MSSDAPALSAIIISLNDEATIARCVRAVVEQECPEPFEVIVVTSGHDRTAAIVREQFPQVTLIELPAPALPGAARNAGLRVARGAYITFPGSHIELFPGSLAARLRAHRLGYPMVTGAAMNGTQTLAGWASYFLDHSTHLPGQPPRVLRDPPVTCSYAREPLLALGGFPEDLRTGEDTTVNLALARAGYTAYQDPQIRFIHYSPCRTPWQLVRHHFTRGRGAGRLLMERYRRERTKSGIRPATVGRTLADGLGIGLVAGRLWRITANVARWGAGYRAAYAAVFPLVVLGALATWAGKWYEITRYGLRVGRLHLPAPFSFRAGSR